GREPAPLLFNFALGGSGPLKELVCLRRLLREGVRPRLVCVELAPPLLARGNDPREAVVPERQDWEEVDLLQDYGGGPGGRGGGWAAVPPLAVVLLPSTDLELLRPALGAQKP